MNHLTFAGVNSDMRNRAGTVGAEKQQITRQDLGLRPAAFELLGRRARHADASPRIRKLHQAAAIHTVGRLAAQPVRGTDQPFGGRQDALAGAGMIAARACGRARV